MMHEDDITIPLGEKSGDTQIEQLRCELARQRQFMAIVAHELRNFLAPLAYSIEVFARSEAEAASRKRRLVTGQINNMKRLVNDLLDLACGEHGQISVCMTPLDLREVIQTSIDVARPAIEAREHRLTVGTDLPSSAIINGDPCRLTQVVSNLLINAAKFTPNGGEIRVSVEREQRYLATHVSDSGIGIAADALAQMFDIYWRGRQPRQTGEGLGLGLAVARYLAEAHGGTLSAYSEGPGKGSEFVMRLPAA